MKKWVRAGKGTLRSTAAIAVLLLGIAPAGRSGATDDHRLVTIRENGLHPQIVQLAPGAEIVWVNRTNRTAFVSFGPDARQAMTCGSESNFHREDGPIDAQGRIESRPLRTGPIVSRCTFAPGEYAYRVETRTLGTPLPAPEREMQGRLIVR